MGTVQAAIANGVLDAVRAGDIPKAKVNDIGIIVAVWLDPAAADPKVKIDHEVLFRTHREATSKAIRKAMRNEPSIDWLLKNQKKVGHYFHELAVKGEL
jgi:formaldehyde-activating enzyme